MPICEQRYLAWCEAMARKSALEDAIATPHSGDEVINGSHPDTSDAESFHSTSSRLHSKSASSPNPLRRRTMSDPKTYDTTTAVIQGRTGTWPRCASSPLSRKAKDWPSIPRRRSSHFSTSPRTRPNLRSFHRESCRLFSPLDATLTDSGYSSIHRAGSSRFTSTASLPPLPMPSKDIQRCSISLARPPVATVVSWKSEETRRMEYSKIDEAHSGLRGLWKKVLPKCCQSRRSWRRFFEGGSCDGESVRRMRMPFSDED